MPNDRGLILADILEEKSTKVLRWQNKKNGAVEDTNKAACLRASGGTDIRKRQKVNVNPSGRGVGGILNEAHDKAPCLTTNKGQGFKIRQVNPSKLCAGVQPRTTDRVYDSSHKGVAITASAGNRYGVEHENIWRDLSVVEACRLQGLPDNYCKSISDSAAYHALGNGWQVDTIIEFFKHLPKE